jgi:hypothetical protein
MNRKPCICAIRNEPNYYILSTHSVYINEYFFLLFIPFGVLLTVMHSSVKDALELESHFLTGSERGKTLSVSAFRRRKRKRNLIIF